MPPDYGTELAAEIQDAEAKQPVKVAVVWHRNQIWVEVRRMYYEGGELKHGKGVRIPIDQWLLVVEASQRIIFTTLGGEEQDG